MPLHEIRGDNLLAHDVAEFAALELYERNDLQRLLRDNVSILGDDLLVIGEEVSNWEDARRRIDLLAIDRSGRLVVIEIKRNQTGGHMDLQAIRYAAMISSMTFDDVLEAFEGHCRQYRSDVDDARTELEDFLDGAEGGDEPVISSDVRILLVSADFGREITTTVLWLNRFEGMDIECRRLVPYEIDGRVLLDIQQVLPLPEAGDYQVKLRRKDVARERAGRQNRDFARFHVVVEGEKLPHENKRNALRVLVEQLVRKGVPLSAIKSFLPPAKMVVLPGVLRDPAAVEAAFIEAFPRGNAKRYFAADPLVDEEEGSTYVLSNQWGRATESKMRALSEAFPEAKVTFERAEPEED
jgi:hypothetical protein